MRLARIEQKLDSLAKGLAHAGTQDEDDCDLLSETILAKLDQAVQAINGYGNKCDQLVQALNQILQVLQTISGSGSATPDGAKLDQVIQMLTALGAKEEKLMATLDDLMTDVQSEGTVIGSIEQLLTNLSQQLAAAIASGNPAKVQAVMDEIDRNKARLAAAVVANTPAAPTARRP